MSDNSKQNKIIKKVKGLLAISKDNKNDEESQSAFMLAQKLMIQYSIDKNDVEGLEIEEYDIKSDSVTIYKKLFWWERTLATIIAENFRVKNYISSKVLKGEKNLKRKIVFFGDKKDLELAKEMYLLAYETVVYHSKNYIDNHYLETGYSRKRYYTDSIKANYIRGFLAGLNKKFEQQVSILRENYEVLVLIPEEVEKAYEDYSASFGKALSCSIPEVKNMQVYNDGFKKGNTIDFTKKTIYTDYSSLINQYIKFSEGLTSELYAKIVSVNEEILDIIVVNASSSIERPSVYKWQLPVDYDYEFLNKELKEYAKEKIDSIDIT